MATARTPEKPPQGQKMPWAGLRPENRPLSRGMHKEKCRHRLRPASGAPVFANGAVTGAFSRAFNDEQESHSRPTLDQMLTELETEFIREFGSLSIDEAKVVLKAAFSQRIFRAERKFIDSLDSMNAEQLGVALSAAVAITFSAELNEVLGRLAVQHDIRRLSASLCVNIQSNSP